MSQMIDARPAQPSPVHTVAVRERRATVTPPRTTVHVPMWVWHGIAAVVGVVGLLLVGVTAASAQTPDLTVRPGAASQFHAVTVTGSGFVPGTPLTVTFVSPTGEEIVYTVEGGTPLIVGADGRFNVTVIPAVDFAGARAGRWTVYACVKDGECLSREFVVTA